jgi:hypothetical protein
MPIKQYSRGSYQQPQNRGLSGLPRMPTRPPGQRPGSTPPQLGNVPRGGQPGQGLQPRVDPGFNLPRPPAPGASGPAGGKGGGGAPPPGLANAALTTLPGPGASQLLRQPGIPQPAQRMRQPLQGLGRGAPPPQLPGQSQNPGGRPGQPVGK